VRSSFAFTPTKLCADATPTETNETSASPNDKFFKDVKRMYRSYAENSAVTPRLVCNPASGQASATAPKPAAAGIMGFAIQRQRASGKQRGSAAWIASQAGTFNNNPDRSNPQPPANGVPELLSTLPIVTSPFGAENEVLGDPRRRR
jgi:hypothetical protein